MPRPARGRPSALTPAVAAEVTRLYHAASFVTVAEIARAVDRAPSTVHGYVRQLHLTRPVRRKPRADREARRDALVRMLAEKPRPTVRELARRLGCTRQTVMRDAGRLGLALEDGRRGQLTPCVRTFRCRCGGRAASPEGHADCRPLGLCQGVA